MKKTKPILTRYLGLTLLLFSVSLSSFAQQNIRGKVSDSNGVPLPGATVVVNGSKTGAITDADGAYTISAPTNAELKFTFIGMVNLIEKVAGRTTINVVLKSESIALNEVVAIGYGTQKRKDLTSAISGIKGDKVTGLGAYSASQALQGKIAGVVVQNNGDPGANTKIRIRGVNTIGSNDPLIIVDGFSSTSINDIHPSDIESIDVLKDAAATAIYGASAAGGVILITTKKGKYGEQVLNVTADASYGVSNVYKRLKLVNSADLVSMIDEARLNENAMSGTRYKTYDQLWPGDNWGRKDITDWQDELYSQGVVKDFSLSIQGGSNKGIYTFSATSRDDQGNMPEAYAKRLTLRGNVEVKVLNDKLKLGSNLSFVSKERHGSEQSDIWSADLFGAAQTPGNIPAYDANGKGYQETDPARINYFTPGGLYQNNTVVWKDNYSPNTNFISIIYADLKILKELSFKSVITNSYSSSFGRTYKIASQNPEGGNSELSVGSSYGTGFNWENILTFDKKINDDINFNLLLGSSRGEGHYHSLNGSRSNFPEGDVDALRYLNYGDATTQTNSEGAGESRGQSYFGRLITGYKDRYLFTASLRQDGSSRFYKDVRWGLFPSFSAGWKISSEEFMKSVSWINLLKLRASWGQVGNSNVGGDYAYLSTVRSGYVKTWGDGDTDYALGTDSSRDIGKVVYQRGNENVTWETLTTSNIGLDFEIKNFKASLDFYRNKTTDMLLPAQSTDIAGYYPGTNLKVNAGEVQTQGYDLSLNYGKKVNDDFGFNVGLIVTHLKNEIISLSENKFVASNYDQNYKSIMGKMSRSYVGDAIGSFYGYNAVGIFNTQAEVDAVNKKARDYALSQNPALTPSQLAGIYYISPKTSPGDRIFEDVNGDGKITGDDEKYLGKGTPSWQFGLNMSANYKAFDLTANFSGAADVQIYSMFEPALSLPGRFNSLASIQDHWTPTNQTSNYPRYTMSDPNGNGRASNVWIHDADYIRLQNLVLGYTLPSKVATKLNLSNVRVYSSVQNLFTITKYPFLEPEVISNEAGFGNGSVDLSAGVDVGSAPLPVTVMLGLNVKF
jgi:TonB-dependent starch-binding outer membrane protein SusC